MRFKKALLIYPPVGFYQRGEERCQADIASGSAINIREPLDLAMIASILAQLGIGPIIRDYPSEHKNWKYYINDLEEEEPDMVLISTTEATIKEDMFALELAREYDTNILTLAKGAVFSSYDQALLEEVDFNVLDIAICGEAEFIIENVLSALHNHMSLSEVKGIAFRKNNKKNFTPRRSFDQNLDSLPYPKRDLINKSLYVRPDTNEPQATIQISRGCPYKCIFCLSPVISGNKVRFRSIENIIGEIEECITKYNIRNFFFRADTFTFNKKFVIDLSKEIIKRGLGIKWVANSRVDTFDHEIALWMKKSGCWLVAFGIESGNQKTLDRIKKNTNNLQAENAIDICIKNGLKTYGFFMIGFPWDNRETIEDTFNLAMDLDLDFIEIHIATPYPNTEFFDIAREYQLIDKPVIGSDYFSNPSTSTLFLTRQELIKIRKTGLRKFYFRRKYIRKKLFSSNSIRENYNYLKYGIKLLKNLIKQ